jgi:hypothetical protein
LLVGTILWLISLGCAFRYFTRVHYDGTALSLILANAAAFILTGVGRLLDAADLFEVGIGFLFMALLIGGVTALLVRMTRLLRKTYEPPPRERTSAQ